MRSKGSERLWARAVGRGLAAAIVTLLLAAGPASAVGNCTTATIEEPFRLPNGLLHAGGKLTLCHERNYSPVAAMHEVRVNGIGVGLFMSRCSTSEALIDGDTRPYMIFHRVGGGELFLVGVATPLRDRMQLHFLEDGTRRTREDRGDLIALANDPVLAQTRTP